MSVQKAGGGCSQASTLDPARLASLVKSCLANEGALAPISLVRVSDLIDGFASFLAASGVRDAAGVKENNAAAFVRSLTRSGSEPSLATMHLRRTALRIFFREAKVLGIGTGDLTRGISLPPRSYRALRALTDEEVARCRSSAAGMLGDSRYAAAWALAEATARIPELCKIARSDCLDGAVCLPGSSSTRPREVAFTSWGQEQVERHLANTPGDASPPLLGTGIRGSLHELIGSTLRRAGLGQEPGVSPNSVPAWRGARELAEGASIEQVTRLLGMRSLDRAAAFIGFDWQGKR